LIKEYKHPYSLLSALHPEYEWLPWKFAHTPVHFWDDINNQKQFFHWAAKKLNIKEMSDWYKISQKVDFYCKKVTQIKDFFDVGGASLLTNKHTSLSALLPAVYPEYKWSSWRFAKMPKNHWDNVNNQRDFVNWAGNQLQIKETSDWYKITQKVQ
jgi:hypothetical protein